MRHLIRLFIILPIAVVLLLFALANRHIVTVSFDPFAGNGIAGPSLTAPLFIVLVLVALVGLLVGGCSVWVSQGRWRRKAREERARAQSAQAEADRLRADLMAARVHNTPLAIPDRSRAA